MHLTGRNTFTKWAAITALALLATLGADAAQAAYVKIANNGSDLPDSAALGTGATDWACTLDTATGLVWEIKTTGNMSATYTNFDSTSGGTDIDLDNNSIGYVNTVNTANLCGAATWRMPTQDELLGLVVPGSAPKINTTYFPNTPSSGFWSGSPNADVTGYAWRVLFDEGYASYGVRDDGLLVRLVRGGQSFDPLEVSATGTGGGSVSRSGGGWGAAVCTRANGTGCNSVWMWPKRSTVTTLTATPATGSKFAGWGGACIGTVGTSCTVTMDGAKAVSAEFTAVISSIVIDPTTPSTLYAALDGAGGVRQH